MKLTIIEPISFCQGVKNAINVVETALKKHPEQQIYVYGEIIHNSFVINKMKEKGVVFLNKNIDEIVKLDNNSILIIPAHGAPKEILDTAANKNLIIYDATCPFIKENVKEIKNALRNNSEVIYIGDENHDESKAILSISKDIYLKDKKLLNKYYSFTSKTPLIICQSTLNKTVLSQNISEILDVFPNAIINKARVCNTTSIRQDAIKNVDKSIDLIIVIGDKTSNNTQKLFDTAKDLDSSRDVYCIESYRDLTESLIRNKNHIAIASGASTPMYIVDEVINFINNLDN